MHVGLSVYICLSIYLSIRSSVGNTGHRFGAFLTLNGSNDVFLYKTELASFKRFAVREMTLKITQGHQKLCHSIGYITFYQ